MFYCKFTFLSYQPCPRIPHVKASFLGDTKMLWCLWLFGSQDVGGAHPVPLGAVRLNADAWISGDRARIAQYIQLNGGERIFAHWASVLEIRSVLFRQPGRFGSAPMLGSVSVSQWARGREGYSMYHSKCVFTYQLCVALRSL